MSNHEDIFSLSATDGTGKAIFRVTMSENKILYLLTDLGFDSISTRTKRKQSDQSAAISGFIKVR